MNKTRTNWKLQVARAWLLAAATAPAAWPALSAALDGDAARSLTSDKTWQVRNPRGPGYSYWAWKSDGSACLRLADKTSKCDDTGRWKLEGDRMCYELTWWGAANGMKSACFRISEKTKGNFEALQDNGLALFEFSLAR